MKNCYFFVLKVFLISLFINNNALADPNILLGNAIKQSALLSQDVSSKKKLEIYADIFKNLDQIVDEHPSSDQAIKLLTNQKIGDFNPSNLRENYVKDLSDYYNVICETSPSYLCIGFVALESGQNQCKIAKNSGDLNEAHRKLKNSISVFISQKAEEKFVNLALNVYKGCVSQSQVKKTVFAQDFYKLGLVQLYIQLGREEASKGIIENMETPYFKFVGVLELHKFSKKPFDEAYFNRLKKYITEKVTEENNQRKFAAFRLVNEAMERGTIPIDYDILRFAYFGHRVTKIGCDITIVKEFTEQIFNYQKNIISISKDRMKASEPQIPTVLIESSKSFDGILNSCASKIVNEKIEDATNLFSAAAFINSLIILLDKEKSDEFQKKVLVENISFNSQIDFAMNMLSTNKDLFYQEIGLKEKETFSLSDRLQFEMLINEKYGKYKVFETLLFYDDVCAASTYLFKDLKKTAYFDRAINSIINAPNIDITNQKSCGDSDLELLLQ